jgi:hypothetical protein
MATPDTVKKPDGTPVAPAPAASAVSSGTAQRTTGKTAEGLKAVEIAGGQAIVNVVPNPLHKFASYTTAWTMACLTKEQFNKPSIYRENDATLTGVVFSSGGRYADKRAKTDSGVPEYFVDNFVMQSVIAASPKTGNSNAVKFSFEIIEPYSMGLLLQSMQVAALQNKYANYLDNAPYLLKLDFMGWDEKMGQYKNVKSKYFVMKLTSIKFEVTESGSKYRVEGVPYNHQGFSDAYNITYTDMKLKGSTVREACTALTDVLNGNEKTLVDEKRIGIGDKYIIEFPTEGSKSQIFKTPPKEEKSAVKKLNEAPPKTAGQPKPAKDDDTVVADPNDIGGSSFGFDASTGGNFSFGFERDKIDEKTGLVKRDKVTIDPKNREFLFSQKQSLTDIITQLIISSKYAKDALNPKRLTDDGFIRWFRLDVQMKFGDFDEIQGDFAKILIYRVVPYLVHHTIFQSPNATPYGYKELEKKIVKKYNYIYTGENVDVIKFDIQINNLFFTGNNASPESSSALVANPDQGGPAPDPGKKVETNAGNAKQTQLAYTGRRRLMRDPNSLTNVNQGGNSDKSTEQKVAEAFHRAFITGSSADMVTVDLEILGDTYWLVDNGMANHFDEPNPNTPQISADGSANYEGSDVFIFITFKTPSDVDPVSGLYKWPYKGKTSPFTGIYRVTLVESNFSSGFFKQKLKCIRMPLQDKDMEGLVAVNATKDDAIASEIKEPKKDTGRVNDVAPPKVKIEPKPPAPPVLAELGSFASAASNKLASTFETVTGKISSLANSASSLKVPTASEIVARATNNNTNNSA